MTYTIAECTVKKKTPDDGQRNCPKHVEFYSKNKFEKLVRLLGFITRTDPYIEVTYSPTTNQQQTDAVESFLISPHSFSHPHNF
jgi:hypothetical protein